MHPLVASGGGNTAAMCMTNMLGRREPPSFAEMSMALRIAPLVNDISCSGDMDISEPQRCGKQRRILDYTITGVKVPTIKPIQKSCTASFFKLGPVVAEPLPSESASAGAFSGNRLQVDASDDNGCDLRSKKAHFFVKVPRSELFRRRSDRRATEVRTVVNTPKKESIMVSPRARYVHRANSADGATPIPAFDGESSSNSKRQKLQRNFPHRSLSTGAVDMKFAAVAATSVSNRKETETARISPFGKRQNITGMFPYRSLSGGAADLKIAAVAATAAKAMDETTASRRPMLLRRVSGRSLSVSDAGTRDAAATAAAEFQAFLDRRGDNHVIRPSPCRSKFKRMFPARSLSAGSAELKVAATIASAVASTIQEESDEDISRELRELRGSPTPRRQKLKRVAPGRSFSAAAADLTAAARVATRTLALEEHEEQAYRTHKDKTRKLCESPAFRLSTTKRRVVTRSLSEDSLVDKRKRKYRQRRSGSLTGSSKNSEFDTRSYAKWKLELMLNG